MSSSRQSTEALNSINDQRQYGSFFEGHENPAASIVSSYDSAQHPPPPPLPKYEDALKLPVYVAPVAVIQTNSQNTSDASRPPPYAEISTITEIVTNAHNRNSIQGQNQNQNDSHITRANTNEERVLPRQLSLEITNDGFV
jgi:hypothetical protein